MIDRILRSLSISPTHGMNALYNIQGCDSHGYGSAYGKRDLTDVIKL